MCLARVRGVPLPSEALCFGDPVNRDGTSLCECIGFAKGALFVLVALKPGHGEAGVAVELAFLGPQRFIEHLVDELECAADGHG